MLNGIQRVNFASRISRSKRAVNARLAENYDDIYASDFESKRKQRKLIMVELGGDAKADDFVISRDSC